MKNKNETKFCKHCQTEIPRKAKVCPNCRKKQGGKLKWIIIVIVVIGIIVIATNNKDDNTKAKKTGEITAEEESAKSENGQKEEDNVFQIGDIVETENLKISFLSISGRKRVFAA